MSRIFKIALLIIFLLTASVSAADIYLVDQDRNGKIDIKDALAYMQSVAELRQTNTTLAHTIAVLQINASITVEAAMVIQRTVNASAVYPDSAAADFNGIQGFDPSNYNLNIIDQSDLPSDANLQWNNAGDTLYLGNVSPGTYTVIVEGTPSDPDSTLAPAEITVTFTIEAGNSPPEASDQSGSIDENLPAGTVVGKVEASDPDGDPLTFNIKDTDVPFEIDNNGNITTTEEFDYENGQTQWTLTIEIDDGKDVKTITYTVDLNDIPQNVSNLSIDDIKPMGILFAKNDPISIKFQFDIAPDTTPDFNAINASLSSSVSDALDLPTITANDIVYSNGHATVSVVATPDVIPPGAPTFTSVSCTVNGQTVTSNEFGIAPL